MDIQLTSKHKNCSTMPSCLLYTVVCKLPDHSLYACMVKCCI